MNILRKFEHILRYKKFIIRTDHSALTWLRNFKKPRGILFRWLQELESYDFEIRHVPGKETGAADGISRSPQILRDPTPEEVIESEEYIGRIGDPDESPLDAVELNRQSIRQLQEEDEILTEVKKWVKGAAKPTKEEIRGLPEDVRTYSQYFKVLSIDEGGMLVMKTTPKYDGEPAQD